MSIASHLAELDDMLAAIKRMIGECPPAPDYRSREGDREWVARELGDVEHRHPLGDALTRYIRSDDTSAATVGDVSAVPNMER